MTTCDCGYFKREKAVCESQDSRVKEAGHKAIVDPRGETYSLKVANEQVVLDSLWNLHECRGQKRQDCEDLERDCQSGGFGAHLAQSTARAEAEE